MITKLLLLAVLLLLACFIAAFLVDRLRQNVQQLAALKKDLARNDEKISARLQELQAMEQAQEDQRAQLPQEPHATLPLKNSPDNSKD